MQQIRRARVSGDDSRQAEREDDAPVGVAADESELEQAILKVDDGRRGDRDSTG
jgi:hypothetical protein